MSKAKFDGETRVSEYLTSAGLRVERFSKSEMRKGRTPDFRVFAGDGLAFYCEVKTAQEDEWLEKQLVAASPMTLTGGLRGTPIYNRISNYIWNAVGQLDAVNPTMERPNVLAIVNGDDSAGFTDLIQVLTGNAYCTRKVASEKRSYGCISISGSTSGRSVPRRSSSPRFTPSTTQPFVPISAWTRPT